MRIPLLHADFEHGSYTKVAKSLRKVWPVGSLSLMQAQNSLAILLGYNSLHDAQREAANVFTIQDGSLSMARIASSVAWRMFLRFDIDLLSAKKLTGLLHLEKLAISSISEESALRRKMTQLQSDMHGAGKFIFPDYVSTSAACLKWGI